MDKTKVFDSYADICKYRVSVLRKARDTSQVKGFMRLLKNPLAPAAFFTGTLLLIASFFIGEASFALTYGALCLMLLCIMCVFTDTFPAFLISVTAYATYPIAEIFKESVNTGIKEEDSLFLYGYVPLLVCLIAVLAVSLILRNKLRDKQVLTPFREDDGTKFVDMILEDVSGVKGYNNFDKLICRISPAVSVQRLMREKNAVETFLAKHKCILCSFCVYDRRDPQTVEFYFYSPDTFLPETLSAFADSRFKDHTEERRSDADWKILRSEIVPPEKQLFEMYNDKMYSAVIRSGMDPAKEFPVEYTVCFDSRDNAEKCAEQIKASGLYIRTHGKAKEEITEDPTAQTFFFTVEQMTKLGIEKMNSNTSNIIDAASANNGHLHHWNIINTKNKKKA